MTIYEVILHSLFSGTSVFKDKIYKLRLGHTCWKTAKNYYENNVMRNANINFVMKPMKRHQVTSTVGFLINLSWCVLATEIVFIN